jgi:threonine dehydrogenase-like Zn-dependent dehydrogenase
MKGAVIHGARDVRFEERDTPRLIEPTDAVIKIAATCVCGSKGVGADSVLECVGTQASMTQAIASTRPGGSVG